MKSIIFVVADQFQPLDVFGPMDAFQIANEVAKKELYRTKICSVRKQKFISSEYGVKILPQTTLAELGVIHTLIISGGSGSREHNLSKSELEVLNDCALRARRVASVCTGAFLLAALNMKKKLTLATHWGFVKELKRSYPNVAVDPESVYTVQDGIWSSAGITAGIDMALAMITKDQGRKHALEVAKRLVVNVCRNGNQVQFSPLLNQQYSDKTSINNRLDELVFWMEKNIHRTITTETMAARLNISSRHLYRLFKEEFLISPSAYLRNIRLDKARNLLVNTESSIENIARVCGFSNADVFRAAFIKVFSNTPLKYKEQFS